MEVSPAFFRHVCAAQGCQSNPWGKFHKYADGRRFASGIFGLVESEGITIGTVIDRGDALRSPTSKIFRDYKSKIGQACTPIFGSGYIAVPPKD